MSAVYAGVVAEAAILAARDPGSRGEAYNITSQGRITQREFLDLFADAFGVPTGHAGTCTTGWRLPAGLCSRCRAGCSGSSSPPRVTRYGAWLLGRRLEYSTEKAQNAAGVAAVDQLSRQHRADGPVVSRPSIDALSRDELNLI